MKVLLIFPPDLKAIEPFASAPQKPTPLLWGFPIGLGYLAAYLKQFGHKVIILDCLRQGYTFDVIRKKIKKINPDLVGINVMTPLTKTAVAVAKLVREFDKTIPVVGGGPHANYDYQNLLENYDFDYIVLGEGEVTFSELVNFLSKKRKARISRKKILGIAYKDKGRVISTGFRPPIENLDTLPYPARNLVNFDDYIIDSLLPSAVEIMGSRGCSHRCVFCSSSHFFGKWRARSPEDIIKEMKFLLERYPQIKSFLFYDDNFTFSKPRVIKLCQLLIDKGLNKYKWNCLARVDQVDEEMLKLMKKAGCQKISYGIESGSPRILKNINKNLNLEVARKAIKLTKKAGIEALAFFMIGNPGETERSIQQSVKFAKELNPTSTLWSITQIYPGTELERMQPVSNFIKYIHKPEIANPSPFTYICVPTFNNKRLGREKLKMIHKKIFRNFTFYHFFKDPVGRVKHLLVSPRGGISFLFNLLRS